MFFRAKVYRTIKLVAKLPTDSITPAQVEELAKTLNQMKQVLQGTGTSLLLCSPAILSLRPLTDTYPRRNGSNPRAAAPTSYWCHRGGPAPSTGDQSVETTIRVTKGYPSHPQRHLPIPTGQRAPQDRSRCSELGSQPPTTGPDRAMQGIRAQGKRHCGWHCAKGDAETPGGGGSHYVR